MANETRSWLSWLPWRGDASGAIGAVGALDAYVQSAPSPQNAIDAIAGWNLAFPPQFEVRAGPGAMYDDPRIHWAAEQFGPLEGKRVLELGPLEGSHTAMLERLGASRVDAIEANKLAYLRCLIAKEILELQRSHFHLGDFVEGLARDSRRYDFIVACGVLYHMRDPLRLLELIAQRADAVYLWTHYFSDEAMPRGDPRRGAFRSRRFPRREHSSRVNFRGVEVTLRERSYRKAWRSQAYCGGPIDLHYWMDKRDIVAVLAALGFDDIRVAHDQPLHANGPSVSIFAQRTTS